MPTNGFLPFATAAGANTLTDAAFATDAILAQGFQQGRVPSIKANKLWRQSSVSAAVLGQFIADYAGVDANDSQTIATLEGNFVKGMQAVVAGAVGIRGRAVFTAVGASAFTVPAGITRIFCQVWGGGGAGGNGTCTATGCAGAGGSAGGYAAGWFTVSPGAAYTALVGAAGAINTIAGGNGGNGGTSSVGALLSALGGQGGGGATTNGQVVGTNFGGGNGSGGDFAWPGQPASGGFLAGGYYQGGAGSPAFTSSWTPGTGTNGQGAGGVFPGGGGQGAGVTGAGTQNGGPGAAGFVVISW